MKLNNTKISYPLSINKLQLLTQGLKLFEPKSTFWKLGENDLSKEMSLTMIMLIGGTPIINYGQEIGQNQVKLNIFF